MSGIIQKQINPTSVSSPNAGSTFISINESGELFTKDSSGNVTVYGEGGGGGSPFPFEGDALIDGTLNIDFTDALDFYSGDSLELVNDPIFQGVLKGDMIGLYYREGDEEMFSGMIDGVNELFGGFAEIGVKNWGTSYKDLDNGDFITMSLGKISIPEIIGGGEQIYVNPMQTVFVNSDNTFTEYLLRVQKDVGTDDSDLFFAKIDDDGEDGRGVYIRMSSDETAMTFGNNLADDFASVYRFEGNNDDTILDIRNDGIYVGPNIPTSDPEIPNKIWLDGDTLKVSSGPI